MINMPHLETEITQACQLSCVACNHSVPLWRTMKGGPWAAEPAQVEKDLNHLAKFVRAEKWGALGGEPLLNRKLIDILKVVRASGIAPIIEVWTNGLLLQRQSIDFWRSFDHLVVSIYPGKLSEEDITWIKHKCDEHGIFYSPRDERQTPNFRTMLEPEPTLPYQTSAKWNNCFFRNFSRNVSYGYFFTCCCGPHIPMLVQGQPFGTDGVKVEGLTEEALQAYLTRVEPLDACFVCAGRDTARPITWHEIKDSQRWLKASAGVNA